MKRLATSIGSIISLILDLPSMTSRTTSSGLMPRWAAWAGIWLSASGVLMNPVLTVKERILPSPSAEIDWASAFSPNLVML